MTIGKNIFIWQHWNFWLSKCNFVRHEEVIFWENKGFVYGIMLFPNNTGHRLLSQICPHLSTECERTSESDQINISWKPRGGNYWLRIHFCSTRPMQKVTVLFIFYLSVTISVCFVWVGWGTQFRSKNWRLPLVENDGKQDNTLLW